MSIVTALERFRDIIVQTPASDLLEPGNYGKGFDFVEEMDSETFGSSRQLGLRISGGAKNQHRAGWFEVDVEAFIDYLGQATGFRRELVIADDHRVISDRMRATSLWQRETSQLMHIKPAGSAEFFPYQVDDVDRGEGELGRRMTFPATVVYRQQL